MTTIYGVESAQADWQGFQQTIGGSQNGTSQEGYYPYPIPEGVIPTYLNKCIDGTTGQWTFWETTFIDAAGAQYTGTTFDAATYRVEAITYQSES